MLARAHRTFDIEAAAILGLKQRVGDSFVAAVRLLFAVDGRIVVMGIGKSGHVARKVAATLASTGSPALFVHPAEAQHGDLGMIQPRDAVLAISNSGETDELLALLPLVKRLGVPLVAITGKSTSTLARHASVVLDAGVDREACPLNLAPTASTTAQMALGDALAVALLDARGFGADDFARSHPGGALGRKLLTHVGDVMRAGDDLPCVWAGTGFAGLMREMGAKGFGAAAVIDAEQRILGIFTDGDLRRLVETGADLRALCAGDVMHRQPRTVRSDALAVEAAKLMEQFGITRLLVEDERGYLCGALNTARPDARQGYLMERKTDASSVIATDTAADAIAATAATTARRPVQSFAPELLLRAQPVRLVFFDVDGVLTDGGLVYGAEGEALKRFNVMDGFGLKLLRTSGIEPVIITGLDGAPLRRRVEVLGVVHAHYACRNKLAVAEVRFGRVRTGLEPGRRHRRRLARPGAGGTRGVRCCSGQRPRRGQGSGALRDRARRWRWRRARALRPVALCQRTIRALL